MHRMREVVLLAATAGCCAAAVTRFSNVFGDDMVIQADAPAPLWGWSLPASTVAVAVSGGYNVKVSTDAAGFWRTMLPSTPASLSPFDISVEATDGENATLHRVLFGHVFLCSGQSNMQFTVSNLANASAEIATAPAYASRVRLFSGDGTYNLTTSPADPAEEVAHIALQWSNASTASVGGPEWKFFSALCWLAVRGVADSLGPGVPIGAMQFSYGGTPIQYWSAPDALSACPSTPGIPCCGLVGFSSCLWNEFIAPLTLGPTRFAALLWMQGEQNGMPGTEQAGYYACALPAMLASWRNSLAAPALPFGVFSLAPYHASSPSDPGFPRIRLIEAALAASDPHTFFISTLDGGDPVHFAIHSPYKEAAGARAAVGLRAVALGDATALYLGPRAASAAASSGPSGSLVATVEFGPAGLYNASLQLNTSVACPAGLALAYCESFAVLTADCVWRSCEAPGSTGATLAASLTSQDTLSLELSGVPASAGAIVAVRSGHTPWPLVQLRNALGTPAEPFLVNITANACGWA